LATKFGSVAPDRGDIVWIDFAPTVGHEQSGRRPAIVLTSRIYNVQSSLALVCPITSRAKGYSFEVPLPPNSPVSGVVLADHVRSVDWNARHADRIGRLADETLQTVLDRVETLLFLR
jgi:mRNA interferase MazF